MKRKSRSLVKEVLIGLSNVLVLAGIFYLIFSISQVSGLSMSPTLDDGDRLFTQKISLFLADPLPGDIVVLESPDQEGLYYIKRVIATGSDKVQLSGGEVYVNDNKLKETYINDKTYPNIIGEDTWLVPENHVFVMGDNRSSSMDSRSFGPVNIDKLVGISEFKIFPFKDFGKI